MSKQDGILTGSKVMTSHSPVFINQVKSEHINRLEAIAKLGIRLIEFHEVFDKWHCGLN